MIDMSHKAKYIDSVPEGSFEIYSTKTNEPPCPGAELFEIRRRDRERVSDVENTNWFERGVNHEKIGDYWYRDNGTQYIWCMPILDLRAFIQENGSCNISLATLGHLVIYLE